MNFNLTAILFYSIPNVLKMLDVEIPNNSLWQSDAYMCQ